MDGQRLDPRLIADLKERLERGAISGELLTPDQIKAQLTRFRDRFGPAVLQRLDGEALLELMHGRTDSEARCLVYWLEFKNDDDFSGTRFGSIAGGSALKFGLYQRQSDNSWITGSTKSPRVISVEEAIEIARQQRNELVAGAAALAKIDLGDSSDAAYARLQGNIESVAPTLADATWAHKYWFLTQYDGIDSFHSATYQRFHIFKLLQMPPDELGIWNGKARFVCAGRFESVARALNTTTYTLSAILTQRSPFHRYWQVEVADLDIQRDRDFIPIAWPATLPDVAGGAQGDRNTSKSFITNALLSAVSNPEEAKRLTRDIQLTVRDIAENDLVVASKDQTVLGIGRVRGPYQFVAGDTRPHKLPIQWLSLETWPIPEKEGRGTVCDVGNNVKSLLEIETRLFAAEGLPTLPSPVDTPRAPANVVSPLDPMHARIEAILRRKGQVLLYGPPGTGKTYHALGAARELAARQVFGKNFESLAADELRRFEGDNSLVRVCTFHPGYGYEDFIEGLRPSTHNGTMIFEPRDGIFKRLCIAAAQEPSQHFFIVIDEINRGDLPRIFGELLTVIELNKRNLKITLPMSGTVFSVPSNVFLIGTMNTADRSISILDTALRRRFGFVELMPDSSRLMGQKVGTLSLAAWLDALNARVRKHLKRDARNLQIGHAYLMPHQPIRSVAELGRVLRDDIVPLLEEYCYDDFQMLRNILGKELIDAEIGRIRDEMFTPAREADLILALSTFEEMETAQEAVDVAGGLAEEQEEDANDSEVEENAPTA